MESKNLDINVVTEKLNRGEAITHEEERFYLKTRANYTDEMIDHIFAIAANNQPGRLID